MSNQFISWSMLILPWLTLFFMKKEEIKYYLPVGIFAAVLTTIIHDVGITYGFWVVWDAAYPLYEMLPYFYGLIPVLTMWVFKFTYEYFWLYLFFNAILDIGFAFFLLNAFFPGRGIYALANITSFQVWLINIGHALALYAFQILLQGKPLRLRSLSLQTASAKHSFDKGKK
ncbi:hypothetical protein [Pelotomaculum propionicicum]|uniref:Uncharacterized protein n=1 Tax=Pelotomaculum propionicicum TaxID=258475 RepID=A0A4Y7RQ55_9FIRM|nr:hypothetical protein [Pelotomaculum propionicicum]NLI11287.1 hypothetical protein [Peptococcaceae bacterium]TEB10991.1 hypothetical protein Pmgp_02007 [Pelotomaculum propionicicum]